MWQTNDVTNILLLELSKTIKLISTATHCSKLKKKTLEIIKKVFISNMYGGSNTISIRGSKKNISASNINFFFCRCEFYNHLKVCSF